ncbi:hypothetical protein ABEO75_04775 [Paenibacillus macerans]|uniref:hypothetical protein n=1 Tax=Paenibacillus macerans TaxID=44252 RepID=UPI002E1B3806|nr:hypothetical protein [Paenibacillus macerans]
MKDKKHQQSLRAQSTKFMELLKTRGIDIVQWTDIGINARVTGAAAKLDSSSMMGKTIPAAVLLLTAILLGNVIGRMIKRESVIAGAGGVLGTVLGLVFVRTMLSVFLELFDIPLTGIDYGPSVIIISLLLPVSFLGASGWLIIRKELKHSPAELMKGSKDKSNVNFLERSLKPR